MGSQPDPRLQSNLIEVKEKYQQNIHTPTRTSQESPSLIGCPLTQRLPTEFVLSRRATPDMFHQAGLPQNSRQVVQQKRSHAFTADLEDTENPSTPKRRRVQSVNGSGDGLIQSPCGRTSERTVARLPRALPALPPLIRGENGADERLVILNGSGAPTKS